MIALLLTAWLLGPDTGPATTPPAPPLPTYIINGDGSRMICTPNFTQCWPDPNGPVQQRSR